MTLSPPCPTRRATRYSGIWRPSWAGLVSVGPSAPRKDAFVPFERGRGCDDGFLPFGGSGELWGRLFGGGFIILGGHHIFRIRPAVIDFAPALRSLLSD